MGCINQAMAYLFSYGTLQLDAVQRSTFGRELQGSSDALIGFLLAQTSIDDAAVVALSGQPRHPIARYSGCHHHRIPGTVFELSDAELQHADRYEIEAYKRVMVDLESGRRAWAYVDADRA